MMIIRRYSSKLCRTRPSSMILLRWRGQQHRWWHTTVRCRNQDDDNDDTVAPDGAPDGAYDEQDWEHIEEQHRLEEEAHTGGRRDGTVPYWDEFEADPTPGIILPDEYQDDVLAVQEPKKPWAMGSAGACILCKPENRRREDYQVSPLNVRLLVKFVNERGMIYNRRRTKTCTRHQKQLAVAIKRANYLGLMSAISNWTASDFEENQWPFIPEYAEDYADDDPENGAAEVDDDNNETDIAAAAADNNDDTTMNDNNKPPTAT